MNKIKKVCVGVITYKRSEGLRKVLESLLRQDLPDDIEAEIFVVDNACMPEAESIINEVFPTGSKITITYFCESSKGIVYARNRCVDEFLREDFDALLFIDDDEWTETDNWISDMCNAINDHSCDLVTGSVISVGEPGSPKWATDILYDNNYPHEGAISSVFYTNNLIIRRNVLENIKPAFDIRFANTGASDYHFSLKCKKKGFVCRYTRANVIETFPKSRAKILWFMRRGFRSGIGYTRSHIFEESLLKAIVRSLIMSAVRFSRGLGNLLLFFFSFQVVYLVRSVFKFSSALGTILAFAGIKYEEYKVTHGR